ncbi:MAG: hypothetical protein NTW86_14515 [Candidatus Sumerlaeota bacterium]|nr:hypothetical protein [Candidatus Sumerlaeota bacterium]
MTELFVKGELEVLPVDPSVLPIQGMEHPVIQLVAMPPHPSEEVALGPDAGADPLHQNNLIDLVNLPFSPWSLSFAHRHSIPTKSFRLKLQGLFAAGRAVQPEDIGLGIDLRDILGPASSAGQPSAKDAPLVVADLIEESSKEVPAPVATIEAVPVVAGFDMVRLVV